MPSRESRLRIGVLGAGAWASRAHIPGWLRDPRCEVVAIADRRARPGAGACARSSASARPRRTGRRVVARPNIDVIDIATPSATHFELAMAAIEAGKHVLCEKPVAFDFRETRARRSWRSEGAEDQARLHLPLQPRRPVRRELIDRASSGSHSSSTATSRTPSGSTPRRRCGRWTTRATSRCCRSRRWRGTARRSSTSGTGGSAPTTPASSARCATSFRSGWCAPTGRCCG